MMHNLNQHKSLVNDLPVITHNFTELIGDDNPILYTGSNAYGNRILGSIIEEDDEEFVLRYFHLIISDQDYNDFIVRKKTLLKLLQDKRVTYIIDRFYNGKIKDINLISFEEIPSDYLPLENSYCPELSIGSSLEYGVSLKGRKADNHLVLVNDANEVQTHFETILKKAVETLGDVGLTPKYYLEPARTGSYRINFNIELENEQISIIPLDKVSIGDYIKSYFNYFANLLPQDQGTSFYESKVSQDFKDLVKKLQSILENYHVSIPENVLEAKVVDSMNFVGNLMEQVDEQIKKSSSFDRLEIFNYLPNGSENSIGLFDKFYYHNIVNKLIPLKETTEDLIETDFFPKPYRILVYQLNVESGKGGARLYYGDTEEYDKVTLHINKNNKSIENSVFTNGLHEGKVIDVKGIARKVNDKYRLLKVDL